MEVKGQHDASVAVPRRQRRGTSLIWDYVGLKDNMEASDKKFLAPTWIQNLDRPGSSPVITLTTLPQLLSP